VETINLSKNMIEEMGNYFKMLDGFSLRTLAGLTSFIIILTITRIIQVIMFMKLLVIVRILKIQSFEINFI